MHDTTNQTKNLIIAAIEQRLPSRLERRLEQLPSLGLTNIKVTHGNHGETPPTVVPLLLIGTNTFGIEATPHVVQHKELITHLALQDAVDIAADTLPRTYSDSNIPVATALEDILPLFHAILRFSRLEFRRCDSLEEHFEVVWSFTNGTEQTDPTYLPFDFPVKHLGTKLGFFRVTPTDPVITQHAEEKLIHIANAFALTLTERRKNWADDLGQKIETKLLEITNPYDRLSGILEVYTDFLRFHAAALLETKTDPPNTRRVVARYPHDFSIPLTMPVTDPTVVDAKLHTITENWPDSTPLARDILKKHLNDNYKQEYIDLFIQTLLDYPTQVSMTIHANSKLYVATFYRKRSNETNQPETQVNLGYIDVIQHHSRRLVTEFHALLTSKTDTTRIFKAVATDSNQAQPLKNRSDPSFDENYQKMVNAARDATKAFRATIFVPDDEIQPRELLRKAYSEPDHNWPDSFLKETFALNTGDEAALVRAYNTKKSVFVDDVRLIVSPYHALESAKLDKVVACVAVPILLGQQCLGVLYADWDTLNHANDCNVAALEEIAQNHAQLMLNLELGPVPGNTSTVGNNVRKLVTRTGASAATLRVLRSTLTQDDIGSYNDIITFIEHTELQSHYRHHPDDTFLRAPLNSNRDSGSVTDPSVGLLGYLHFEFPAEPNTPKEIFTRDVSNLTNLLLQSRQKIGEALDEKIRDLRKPSPDGSVIQRYCKFLLAELHPRSCSVFVRFDDTIERNDKTERALCLTKPLLLPADSSFSYVTINDALKNTLELLEQSQDCKLLHPPAVPYLNGDAFSLLASDVLTVKTLAISHFKADCTLPDGQTESLRGILQIESGDSDAFSFDDLELLKNVSASLASAMAEMYQTRALRFTSKIAAILFAEARTLSVSQPFARTNDTGQQTDVWHKIIRAVHDFAPDGTVFARTLNQKGDGYDLLSARLHNDDQFKNEEEIVPQTVDDIRALLNGHSQRHLVFSDSERQQRALVAWPSRLSQSIIGRFGSLIVISIPPRKSLLFTYLALPGHHPHSIFLRCLEQQLQHVASQFELLEAESKKQRHDQLMLIGAFVETHAHLRGQHETAIRNALRVIRPHDERSQLQLGVLNTHLQKLLKLIANQQNALARSAENPEETSVQNLVNEAIEQILEMKASAANWSRDWVHLLFDEDIHICTVPSMLKGAVYLILHNAFRHTDDVQGHIEIEAKKENHLALGASVYIRIFNKGGPWGSLRGSGRGTGWQSALVLIERLHGMLSHDDVSGGVAVSIWLPLQRN